MSMNTIVWIITVPVVLVVVMFFFLGWHSARIEPTLMVSTADSLPPCPDSPNCVCSEAAETDAVHGIAPLKAGVETLTLSRVRASIEQLGGRIESASDRYLHATFVSPLFRFVDDVEVLAAGEIFHVRSASRVGYSDLSANRKRIEALRSLLGPSS